MDYHNGGAVKQKKNKMDYHGENMKITIRPKIFETNSSSLHALSVFTPDIFRDFENGELLFA